MADEEISLGSRCGSGDVFCGGDPPARHHAHSLTFDWNTGNAVLVGGVASNGQTFLSDTWYYNNGWTQASPATALPPVGYHQAVYADDRILVVAEGQVWAYE